VTRAFLRASNKETWDKKPNPDYGRYVPSSIVLDGHRKVSEFFPGYLSSGNYALIELYDTSTKEPQMICHMEGKKDLRIDNFASFIEFTKKRYINTKASSEETVYDGKYYDHNILKPEYVADGIAEYLKKGIKINYREYTTWDKALISRDLGSTLGNFAKDFQSNDGKYIGILFEVLILGAIKEFGNKDSVPIKLKANNNVLSIFETKIEHSYLPKGAIYRFLECTINNVLKDKGVEISEEKLSRIARDVLKTIISKKLSREEDKFIKYLPALIEQALHKESKANSVVGHG